MISVFINFFFIISALSVVKGKKHPLLAGKKSMYAGRKRTVHELKPDSQVRKLTAQKKRSEERLAAHAAKKRNQKSRGKNRGRKSRNNKKYS